MADHILTELDETGNGVRADEVFCCTNCEQAEAVEGQPTCVACESAANDLTPSSRTPPAFDEEEGAIERSWIRHLRRCEGCHRCRG